MKKLTALLLALVMVLAIGATALATGETGTGETGSGSGSTTTPGTNDAAGDLAHDNNPAIKAVADNTLTLNKTLIVFNPEEVDVYLPNANYSYTVAPFDVNGATVEDNDSPANTVTVKDGVTGGLTVTTSPSFTSEEKVKAKKDGVLVEKPLVLTVNPTVFAATGAGIYRYTLTETTVAGDLNNVGITRDTAYDSVRYIDLYVTNGNDGLEVKNAVVFKAVDALDPETGKITPATEKTTGFNEGSDDDDDFTDDTAADHYYTYNLKVEKETTGNLADKTHQFPFAVSINGIKAGKITFAGVGVAAADAEDATVTSGSVTKGELTESSALKLKNGDSVTFYGIPYGAMATVSEYNDTPDEYKALKDVTKTTNASTEVKLGADVTLTSKTPAAKAELAEIKIDAGTPHTSADSSQSSANTTLAHFTNNLPEISPTGVVLRVAPYAIMLGAGVVLFIVLKLRKNKAAEA